MYFCFFLETESLLEIEMAGIIGSHVASGARLANMKMQLSSRAREDWLVTTYSTLGLGHRVGNSLEVGGQRMDLKMHSIIA